MHTLANTLLWIRATLSNRVGEEGKKTRQTVEREMDERDEEITRADTKRVKGNKSFTKGGGSRSGV